MRIRGPLLALGLAVLVLPAASAVLVPTHGFQGQMVAIDPNAAAAGGATPELTMLTGELELTGRERGIVTIAGANNATIEGIRRLEAFDTGGKAPTSVDPQQLAAEGRQMPRFFDNVSVAISQNSTLLYYTGETHFQLNVSSGFSLAMPLLPPATLGELNVQLVANSSLAIVGPAGLTLTPEEDASTILAFTNRAVRVEVRKDGELVDELEGSTWVYRVLGTPTLRADGDALLVPLAHEAKATIRPGDPALAQGRLDLNRLGDAYRAALPNATAQLPKLDQAVTSQLKAAASIFNGVVLGNMKGNVTVAGDDRTLGPLTLMRFDELTLTPGAEPTTLSYEGKGAFLLAGSQLYTQKAVAGPASFPFPLLALALWLLALGAIVLGRVVKPVLDPQPAFAARPIRLFGLLFHLLMIPVGFVLWDIETKVFLGASILGGGNADGLAFAAVAAIQGITFTLAWLYFGLPVRFLVNTCFRLASMRRARGIGKGISYLTAWGLGAAHYALLLNPFIGLFVESVGGFK